MKKSQRKNSKKEFNKSSAERFKRDNIKGAEPAQRYDSKDNDASWYTRNAQLTADAGRLSFNTPLGKPIEISTNRPFSVPGVMTLKFLPTVGVSKNESSPVNMASLNMYSFVRHANSGHSNYDHQDLMLYMLAMDSVYTFYAHLTRLYGTLALYSQRNRYLPRALVEAEGFDFDDCIGNIADLRYFINQCAVRIGSMCVPNSFTYYARHVWMSSGMYSDSLSEKAQIYMYRPGGYHTYEERDGAGYLKMHMLSDGMTFSQIRSAMDEMINKIIQSEDMNIMSGDILKAFGQDNLIKLNQITENYVVVPQYSEEVLEQIQNATVFTGTIQTDSFNITQDINTGALKCNPKFVIDAGTGSSGDLNIAKSAVASSYISRRPLAALDESPSPERVLTMTRCTNMASHDGVGNLTVLSCASEVIWTASMYYIKSDSSVGKQNIAYSMLFNLGHPSGVTVPEDTEAGKVMATLSDLSVFNHHPMVAMQMMNMSGSAYTNPSTSYHWDPENFTLVSLYELDKLHETSVLSMFNVPQMGAAWSSMKA